MDDLMNKIGALIEEHVKAEVASRRAFDESEHETRFVALFGVTDPRDIVESAERAVKERDKLRTDRDSLVTRLRGVIANRDKYRTMWEQLHLAHTEHLDAKEQLKELLALLGLDGVSPETVKGALLKVRAWDKDLRDKHDNACAQRDESVRHTQALREQVRALELKLLEVRNVVADEARAPVEVGGFKVGDLVRNLLSAPCIAWGRVTRVGRHVEVTYPTNREAIAYKPDELCRKPVGVGDMVRNTVGTRIGKVIGTSEHGDICHFEEMPMHRTRGLIAIAP